MRQYILPEEGEVLVSADFHSQEIRVLGHFAEGAIMQVYNEDPKADIHAVAADLITDTTGLHVTRKETKIVAFSILYGAGVKTMAGRMGISTSAAGEIKRAYLNILTGVKEFMREVEARAAANLPAKSWGGRLLHRPDPVVEANGHVWNKDYVLLNYLIQGSSADLTKASIVAYDKRKKYGTFLATVHDEIVISVPPEHLSEEIGRLCFSMDNHDNLEVPMRATVKYGPNWANMKDYE
jgi:DNA polymerase-1